MYACDSDIYTVYHMVWVRMISACRRQIVIDYESVTLQLKQTVVCLFVFI